MQQTLVIVKPDGVQRALVGRILARFEERGMKIVALKLLQVDRDLAEKHYAVHKGKFFYEGLVSYITSSPVVAMILEGALSFLGLGTQPPAPSWGSMLSRGRQYMTIAPWLVLAPGLAIMLAVLGFNLLGDAERDLLDPRRAGAGGRNP